MRRSWSLVLVVPVLLAIAGCAPASRVASHHPIAVHDSGSPLSSVAPSLSPTPTPTVTTPAVTGPVEIVAKDYLIEGTPHVPDANGEWFGQWAFYTDATKSVWCQFIIFSADNPGATCSIVPAARSKASYPLPPGSSVGCKTSDWDGYTLALAASAEDLIPKDAGWDQCFSQGSQTAADLAKTKVLPDGATLGVAPFSCTVHGGVATCAIAIPGQQAATLTLGLHVASFHSTS
jgi:hypothetical protein